MKIVKAAVPFSIESLQKRVGTNTLWLFIGQVGTQGFQVFFVIVLARRLGDMGLGVFSFITSVIYMANIATTFGTDMFLIRKVSSQKDFRFVLPALFLQIGLSLTVIVSIYIFPSTYLTISQEMMQGLQLFSLALLAMSFSNICSALLRGLEQMQLLTKINLFTAMIQILGLILWITPKSSLNALLTYILFIHLFTAGVFGFIVFRQNIYFRKVNLNIRKRLGELLRTSAPLTLLAVLSFGFRRGGIYMMMLIDGASPTGWYAAALRVAEAPKFVHYALLSALLPVMSSVNVANPLNEHKKLFRNSFIGLIIFSTLVAVILSYSARLIILLFFGAEFHAAADSLKILAWNLIPFTVTNYLTIRLFGLNQEKKLLLPLIINVGILYYLSKLFIPLIGAAGAATAAIISESTLAVFYIFIWQKIQRSKDAIPQLS